jgi:hypothetical protein
MVRILQTGTTNSHFQANNFFDVFRCICYLSDFNIYIFIHAICYKSVSLLPIPKARCHLIKYNITTVLTVLCSELGNDNRKIRTTFIDKQQPDARRPTDDNQDQ